MTLRRLALTALFGLVLAWSGATTASAFCGVLRYSASALSDQDATKAANALGLVEVRKLNQRYGNRVKYDPASVKCSGASHVRCTITQRYCVADARNGAPKDDDCPGDSVRDKSGKCVKEYEPVRANPCSGGRLYSLSRKVCHCPENLPVWTGQRCISAKPVSGPTNKEIVERCLLLEAQCKSKIPGTCSALQQYCERG